MEAPNDDRCAPSPVTTWVEAMTRRIVELYQEQYAKTNETFDLTDEKRKARMNRHRSNIDRRAYSVLAKKTKQSAVRQSKMVRRAMYRLSASEAYSKWHYLNWSIIIIIIIIDIQQSVDQAKTKKAYHLIKKIKKKYVPRTS